MSYRIWDNKRKKWVNENMYLTPDGELYESYKSILGNTKLTPTSHDRYIYHKSIDLYDKDGTLVYVGDYIEAHVAEDRVVTGLVTYANELSAYVILCFDTDEYFTLGNVVSQDIKVVGNVFDEDKKGKRDGKQTL